MRLRTLLLKVPVPGPEAALRMVRIRSMKLPHTVPSVSLTASLMWIPE